MNEQLLRKSDANALSSRKKNNSEKPYGGVEPPPLVPPRVNALYCILKQWIVFFARSDWLLNQ